MKFRNCLFYSLLAVLFVSFTACEKENELEELTAEIPVAIKRDFNAKYPLATVTSFHAYSDSLNEIEFVNDLQNKATVWYDKNVWKFTYTHVYYIESPDGNSYHLQDKNHDQELGYILGEGI